MSTDEEKLEYWANVIMGGWVRAQADAGLETFDVATFAMIKQGVVMGLESPVPDGAAWDDHLKSDEQP